MSVKSRLQNAKIERLALDLFGFCNAKCWYCPVRYIPQPEEGQVQMPIADVERIFRKLLIERSKPDGNVSKRFNTFVTTHFSEVLLYKDFDKLLHLARKYKLKTFVLSNGLNLTPEKVDLISEYAPDVVPHIGLNVPIFESAELWSKRTGFPEKRFDDLMKNLEYLNNSDLAKKIGGRNGQLFCFINGLTEQSFGTELQKGPKFDELGITTMGRTEHDKQYQIALKMLTNFTGVEKSGLVDRAGLLTDYISNQEMLSKASAGKEVVGCTNWGDRVYDWLSVNSKGDAILCCNDYNFDYKFGNIIEQDLSDFWASDTHVETIERAYANICKKCTSAVFK